MVELPTTVAGLVPILQKCRNEKDLGTAMAIFLHARKYGMESQTAVGNHLVSTLADCGALDEANQVFNNLPYRNERLWTSLMSCHIDRCEPQNTLALYEKMQRDRVAPSTFTVVVSLKACAGLGDLAKGHKIHKEILCSGCEKHVFIGNALVDMYAKCRSCMDALVTLRMLQCRDVVTWTAVINGHVEHGHFNEAVGLLDAMHEDGVSPNLITFVCILRAVAGIKRLSKGFEVHTQIVCCGLEGSCTVGNTLVVMYGKCSSLSCAKEVFSKLSYQGCISWNALITGYAEHGFNEDVIKVYVQMQFAGVSPDAVTFNCVMKAIGSLKALKLGQNVHADVVSKSLEDPIVGNAVVDMYVQCNMMNDAEEVLLALPLRDVVSWNILILGYAEQGLNEHVSRCFRKMQEENIAPDSVTYISALKAYNGHNGAFDWTLYLHKSLTLLGCEQNAIVGSALVDMYAKAGMLADAQKSFDNLSCQHVSVWSALVAGYSEHGSFQSALKCYLKMQAAGISPDSGIYICLLKAFKAGGPLFVVHELHCDILQRGYEQDVLVCGTLVDIYAKYGSLSEAQQVFNVLPLRDIVIWSTLIRGYGMNHEGISVVKCFEDMRNDGIEPDSVTFACLLSACSHMQLVSEGQELFSVMRREHGFVPDVEHYTCMVDLLAKSGYLDDAKNYMEGTRPYPSILTSLLTACHFHGVHSLGKKCFQQLI